MLIPQNVSAGDKIAIVAPAKKIQTDLNPAFSILRSWGLTPVLGKHLYKTSNYFSGIDKERLEDLQWALDHPEIKAILIARGGYGTTRIIDQLNWSKFYERPKWICGFSDLTSLHSFLNNKEIASIHGPMAVTLDWDGHSANCLKKLLFGEEVNYSVKGHLLNQNGIAKAELVGGNLSILCNSIGTSSDITTKSKILFLEEVGEYLYHLDRMLVHLNRAGKLQELSGAIIGDFSSMKDHTDSFGAGAYDIIASHLNTLNIPIAYGFPMGHEKKNYPLICGAQANFQIVENQVELNFSKSNRNE